MKAKIILTLLFILKVNAYSLSCYCPLSKDIVNIDTLAPGTVAVSMYVSGYDIESYFTVDTFTQQALLDSLIADYEAHNFAVIGYIDTVFRFTDSINDSMPVYTLGLRESLSIVIDTSLKNPFPHNQIEVYRSGMCLEVSNFLVKKPFIVFFNLYDSISHLNMEPGPFCGGPVGCFIENDQILKKGV